LILSNSEIREALNTGAIVIEPSPAAEDYTTSAVDLHLGDELFEFVEPRELASQEPEGVERPMIVDVSRISIPQLTQRYARRVPTERDGSFLLGPSKFVLGITKDFLELPEQSRIAARVEGRSTLARLGLVVHMTAPTIHSGFRGAIVLEMYNFGPYTLRIRPGVAICQLIFEQLGREPEGTIRTAYQDQRSVRG
jgi:dCTP deaminase